MSLINQMLQDLDARQAVPAGRRPLPSEVRSLPVRPPSRRPYMVGGVGVLALAAGLAFYLAPASAPPPAPLAVPPPPAPTVASVAAVAPPAPSEAAAPPVTAPVEPPTSSETTPREEAPRLRPAQSIAPPAVIVSKTAKPSAVFVEKKPESIDRPPKAVEADPPAPAEPSRPLAGKPPKGASIERSDVQDAPAGRGETSYRKAIGAINQGRVAEALDELRAALRDDPMHRGARQLLTKLLLEARRVDEAMGVLQEGLQGQPAQIGWAMSLARLQVDRGDLAGAWKTLDDALPAAGQSADYQGFAAHVLQRLGRQREAIARYQAATRLAPGDGRWWLGLGLAHEAEGNTAEARDAFTRARQSGNLSPELVALAEQKLR